MDTLKIGTRGSMLALWQANWVKSQIIGLNKNIKIELKIIKTSGDIFLGRPLSEIGGKGLFVKEIEEALIDKSIDLAVHSMKDVPFKLPQGLGIDCLLKRHTPHDSLVSKTAKTIADLKLGAKIGTSSLRRSSQILAIREDLKIEPLRGNVDTRLGKLRAGQYDAIILSQAGLDRLELADDISHPINENVVLPAVAQGAIGIETRVGDTKTNQLLSALNDDETNICIKAERSFLKTLKGNCKIPIGAYSTINNDQLTITALIAQPDGKVVIKHQLTDRVDKAEKLGIDVGELIINNGGKAIIDRL